MKQVQRVPEVLERMQMAFELYEVAEVMKRQNLRRSHPDLDDDEIDDRVLKWLYRRLGVEHGDVDGSSFVPRRHLE